MRVAFERLSVLIAEDDPFQRRLLGAWLEAFGARELRAVADGAQAWEAIRRAPPDLLLADWEMPGLDGLALARRVRDRAASPCPLLPIVMISSHAEKRRVMRALRAGINAYVVKPTTPAALYERILGVLADTRPFVATPAYFGPDRTRPFAPATPPEDA